MSKKHFIALADAIRAHNKDAWNAHLKETFTRTHLEVLADFCREQNPQFDRERWLGYIAGTNGPSGGAR